MKEEDEEYATADEKAEAVAGVMSIATNCVVDGKLDGDLLEKMLLEMITKNGEERDAERAAALEAEAKGIKPKTRAEQHTLFMAKAIKRYGDNSRPSARKILRWEPRISEENFWPKLEAEMILYEEYMKEQRKQRNG